MLKIWHTLRCYSRKANPRTVIYSLLYRVSSLAPISLINPNNGSLHHHHQIIQTLPMMPEQSLPLNSDWVSHIDLISWTFLNWPFLATYVTYLPLKDGDKSPKIQPRPQTGIHAQVGILGADVANAKCYYRVSQYPKTIPGQNKTIFKRADRWQEWDMVSSWGV